MNKTELFIRLIKENPELPILPMVDSEIVAGDDFSWWMASFGESFVGYYYNNDEHCIVREYEDDCDIFDECFDIEEFDENITDEEISKIVDRLEWTKAILIRIDLP
jgi:hypothetical protein